MTVSGDYEKILEDNLKDELEWLEEELSILFKDKKSYSNNDIIIGNYVIDNVIDNIRSNDNEVILNLLAITLNKIEQTYPRLFN